MKHRRKFQGSDAFMAENARTIYNLFVQDLAQFTAYNTRFTSAYAETFLAQINAADKVVTDASIVAKQGVETQKVINVMQQARRIYNRVKSHAQWAFADVSPAIVKEFTSGYKAASTNQPKMLVFLETLENTVRAHLEDLTDSAKGGMPPNILDDLVAIKEQLKTSNVNQEVYKKQRLAITEERIVTLNSCYQSLMQVNNTAQLVFAEQPAKRSQYSYRPATESNTAKDYSGSLAPQQTLVIASIDFEAERYISFENKGIPPIQFDLSLDQSTLEGNIVELESGATSNQPMSWLINDVAEGTKVNLLVHNPSASETANYWASINLE